MNTDIATVRKGEELNEKKLLEFLNSRLGPGNSLQISQFPAGSSNLTYLISYAGSDYVLRRPPFGNTVNKAHDMQREYSVLSRLSAVYPPAPKPIFLCSDPAVIGTEFFLMERRKGLILRGDLPQGGNPTHGTHREICRGFIESLVRLHSIDPVAAELDSIGHPKGYVRRQVGGWTDRYTAARTDEWPGLERSIDWMLCNIPVETGRASVIHNDYKFDNVMLDPIDLTKLTTVLDWEMATIGDPMMDLGTTLAYWMSPDAGQAMMNMPFNPQILMQDVSRAELVEMYSEASGRDIGSILFYYVFGTVKVAVIAQQIFARYKKGHTSDLRFASFNKFVCALGNIASHAIDTGKI
ncbi:MAG: phosphotransferase family protein [Acidobacteriota bacterium]